MVIGDFNLHEYAVFKEYLSIFDDLLTNVTTKEPTWGKYKLDYIYVNSEMKKLIHKSKAFPHMKRYILIINIYMWTLRISEVLLIRVSLITSKATK